MAIHPAPPPPLTPARKGEGKAPLDRGAAHDYSNKALQGGRTPGP